MKRQALDHTKMDLLMARLKIRRYEAVGILESLWHLTAREAPQGNIGKLSDERIAIGIDWRGAASRPRAEEARRLIDALVESGWLDRGPSEDNSGSSQHHRGTAEVPQRDHSGTTEGNRSLTVHDWHEHCDEAVRKYMKRNGLQWAVSRHVETSRDVSSLPVPVPVPEPVPAPEALLTPPQPAANVRELQSTANRFREWIAPWPRVADEESALRNWISRVTPQTVEAAFACRDRYLASDEVARGICNEPWKFIRQQSDNNWAGKWPLPRASPAPQSDHVLAALEKRQAEIRAEQVRQRR